MGVFMGVVRSVTQNLKIGMAIVCLLFSKKKKIYNNHQAYYKLLHLRKLKKKTKNNVLKNIENLY